MPAGRWRVYERVCIGQGMLLSEGANFIKPKSGKIKLACAGIRFFLRKG